MNNPFEVKRYWSDSDDNDEECADINTQKIKGLISNENQETDILKKLKSKAKSKRQTKISDVETIIEDNNEQKLYVNENIEINETQQEIKTKKRKRKRSKKLKDETIEGRTKGGFPILGENLANQWKKQKIRRSLPPWLANPDVISVDLTDDQMTVEGLSGLDQTSIDNLRRNKIAHFFPVQRQVIPYLLANNPKSIYPPHDICVSAPTGSGKTLAFVLPIGKIRFLYYLASSKLNVFTSDNYIKKLFNVVQALRNRVVPQVRALIILPVQDLANQVYRVFRQYCEGTSIKPKLLSGQQSFAQEKIEIIKPNLVGGYHSLVDIVIATPGRIVDHIRKTEGFDLSHLRFLVIDEADRIMEDIQNDWLTHVENSVYSFGRERLGPLTVAEIKKRKLPLQKLLFSATLSQNPEKLEKMNLFEPKLFTSVVQPKDIIRDDNTASSVNDENCPSESVNGEFIGKFTIPAELKEVIVRTSDTLLKPLVLHHVITSKNMKKVLVFTKSSENSHKLTVMMRHFGLSVEELSSKVRNRSLL